MMLNALTYLAPRLFNTYRFMLDTVAKQLNLTITLSTGSDDYHEFGEADLLFICGLPYILRTAPLLSPSPIEALVAPVLHGQRYAEYKPPVYFSDVIVHVDSDIQTFADLRGRSWAYNEPESQSGYGVMRYELVRRGLTGEFLGHVVHLGHHHKSIRGVINRIVDAATIDSQVLEIFRRDHPKLGAKLRVIATLGPSTIQPLAVRCSLPGSLKQDVRDVFLEMHQLAAAQPYFNDGLIDHFVAVADTDYNMIRQMYTDCQQAGFMAIR